MGFDLQHIVSDETHYAVFECVICQQLLDLDALVTSIPSNTVADANGGCSHAFCRTCLSQWVLRSDHCPTCHHNLLYTENCHPNSNTPSMMMGDKSVAVQPLARWQPLAYRSLKRIQVSCPFASTLGCSWKGDYGDLQSGHLAKTTTHHQSPASTTSSSGMASSEYDPEEESRTRERCKQTARLYKEEANNQFQAGHYREACDMYTKAIETLVVITPKKHGDDDGDANSNPAEEESVSLMAALYANRSATHLVQRDFRSTEEDATRAIQIDATYGKAYSRKAKALVQQGNLQLAVETLQSGVESLTGQQSQQSKLLSLQKELKTVLKFYETMTRGLSELDKGLFATAKATFSRLLSECHSYLSQSMEAPNLLLAVAKADLCLGLTDSALRLTLQVIKKYPRITEAYTLRGTCYIFMTEYESGLSLIKEALRRDPDSAQLQQALKSCRNLHRIVREIQDDNFHRRFDQVVQKVTNSMHIVEQLAQLPPKSLLFCWLYTTRATSYFRLKEYQKSLKDCALVLYHREDHVNAWLVRFQALGALGRHEEARDLSAELLQTWGAHDSRIKAAYDKADFELRKLKRPNFYAMLGVSPLASEREIKKAYRQKAMEVHPDRLVQKSKEEQKQAQSDFQLLGDGLEILTDDFKKQLYDQGYDLKAIQERVDSANHCR